MLGAFSLVTTALGISAFLSRMTSACASYHWGSCFTPETEVAWRWRERSIDVSALASSSNAFELRSEDDESWSGTWSIAAAGVVVVTATVWRRDRRRRRKWEDEIATCFASGRLLDDLLMPTPKPSGGNQT